MLAIKKAYLRHLYLLSLEVNVVVLSEKQRKGIIAIGEKPNNLSLVINYSRGKCYPKVKKDNANLL